MLEPTGPERRVDDDERNQTIEVLRRHTGAGRLTLDEFSDRAGAVFEARTAGELERVTADLPALPPDPVPASSTGRRRAVRFTVSILGGNSRRGRWRVSGRTAALAIMGGTELDLRNAEFDGEEIHITAIAVMGGVDVIVPEGVQVEVTGLAIMGGKESKVRPGPIVPGAPVVRVAAFALMGGVTVRNKRLRGEDPSGELASRHRQRREAIEARRDERHERRQARRGGHQLTPAQVAALPQGTVTLMFTDVEDSTGLFERAGDGRARSILGLHNRIVRDEIARHGGQEVKNQGDGFMVVFRSAAAALRCAVAVQEALALPLPGHDESVRVRIGIHAGDVEAHDGDIVGLAVSTAARIADAARGGEILASSTVRDLVAASKEFAFDAGREVELRGVTDGPRVFGVGWRP